MGHEQPPRPSEPPKSPETQGDAQVVVELESADAQTGKRKFLIRAIKEGVEKSEILLSGWWANKYHTDGGNIPVVETNRPDDVVGGSRVAYDIGSPSIDGESDDEAKKRMILRVVGTSAAFLAGAAGAAILHRYIKPEGASENEQ